MPDAYSFLWIIGASLVAANLISFVCAISPYVLYKLLLSCIIGTDSLPCLSHIRLCGNAYLEYHMYFLFLPHFTFLLSHKMLSHSGELFRYVQTYATFHLYSLLFIFCDQIAISLPYKSLQSTCNDSIPLLTRHNLQAIEAIIPSLLSPT